MNKIVVTLGHVKYRRSLASHAMAFLVISNALGGSRTGSSRTALASPHGQMAGPSTLKGLHHLEGLGLKKHRGRTHWYCGSVVLMAPTATV